MRRVAFRSRMRRLLWLPATASLPLGTCAAPDSRGAGFSLRGESRLRLPGIVSSPYSEVRAAVSPDGAPSVGPAHPRTLLLSGHREGGPGRAGVHAIDHVVR